MIDQADKSRSDCCYRCEYDLRGVADDQPCPECGLAAIRSRRVTDDLHRTRPTWLRRLSVGIWLIVLSVVIMGAAPFVAGFVSDWMADNVFYAPPALAWSIICAFDAVILLAGLWLLATPENYEPADRADRWLRISLRVAGFVPPAALTIEAFDLLRWLSTGVSSELTYLAVALGTVGCAPLPLLVALRLRGLARRARSAHLAEHCVIVGVGTSLTLAYGLVLEVIVTNADKWFRSNFLTHGQTSLILMVILPVASGLFWLWSLYLSLRFAIAFWRVSRRLQAEWRQFDRAEHAR